MLVRVLKQHPTSCDGFVSRNQEFSKLTVPSNRCPLLRPRRVGAVQLAVALFDTASPLVAGNGGTDMVWTSPLACSSDFMLAPASGKGKHLIAEVRRPAIYAS